MRDGDLARAGLVLTRITDCLTSGTLTGFVAFAVIRVVIGHQPSRTLP